MNRRNLIILLLVILPLLSACGFSGRRLSLYECVTKLPARNDIVGTWIPDEAAAEDLRKHLKHSASVPTELILRDDDSFTIVNMPDWWIQAPNGSPGALSSASGTWKLVNDSHQGCWTIGLEFPEAHFYTGTDLLKHEREQKPKYVIPIQVGDPDHDEPIALIRKE